MPPGLRGWPGRERSGPRPRAPRTPKRRRGLHATWLLLSAVVLATTACDFNGDGTVDLTPGATVVNPPPLDPPIFSPFEATFFGWRFGGAVSCEQRARPIAIAIWEGITDPCTQTPEEESRVVFLEVSDITAGTYAIEPACPVGVTKIARGTFGVVRGQRILVQEAEEGQVTLQGVSIDDTVAGNFSVWFSGETGFTSGSFRLQASCL